MSSENNLSRRDMLKKSAIAGGIAWVAPAVLSSPASANHVCNCPHGSLFALKRNNNATGNGTGGCEAPGTTVSTGNCGASGGFTDFRNGCCLATAGLVSFSGGGSTHTWTLAQGVRFCAGFAKCGNTCFSSAPQVVVTPNADGTTTVVMSCPDLSHSEIYVCVDGTTIPAGC